MKTRYSLLLKLSIVFIFVYLIFIYFLNQYTTNNINQNLNSHLKAVNIHIDLQIKHFEEISLRAFDKFSNDPKILDILNKLNSSSKKQQAVLRKELYAYLSPYYKRLKKEGVKQFQFVNKNNISLLRVHRFNKFGDDLTNYRYSYKYVNENKKSISGFENGRLVHGWRHVYPIIDKQNNHIGAMEISFASDSLQKGLIELSKIHSHFIVKKDLFKNSLDDIDRKGYIKSIENDEYLYLGHKTHEEKKFLDKSLLKKIKDNMKSSKEFVVYEKKDGKIKVISFVPVKNIKDKEVKAYIVSYSDDENISILLKDFYIFITLVFIIMVLVFGFIYILMKEKKGLKDKISKQTNDLIELNNNLEEIVIEQIAKNKKKEEMLAQQSKLVALGEMMDAIAHQWKQPLNIISVHNQSLEIKLEIGEKIEEDEIKKMNSVVETQIQHLVSTIDEFRKFFRPNSKKSLVKLDQIVDSSLKLLHTDIVKHKIKVDITGKKDVELYCVAEEIKHIFINFINNAKDAFNENNIKNRTLNIDLAYDDQNNIVLKVIDNAGGIPEDIIGNIFKSNFTTKEEDKGTGIGLYLVKQIVEKFDGKISAYNVDNGVCFEIVFMTKCDI